MTPSQSEARAREIVAMPPGNARHRYFDELVNAIAQQNGHGAAVDLFEQHAAPDHYDTTATECERKDA
jgi:hypothetical protein